MGVIKTFLPKGFQRFVAWMVGLSRWVFLRILSSSGFQTQLVMSYLLLFVGAGDHSEFLPTLDGGVLSASDSVNLDLKE